MWGTGKPERIATLKEKKPSKETARPGAPSAGGPMDVDLVQRLVDLMVANDLNTVDVRDGTKRIVLTRGATAMMMPGPMAMAPTGSAHPPVAAKGAGGSGADDEAGMLSIRSPMVGTFYSKPNPESKPFVTVGSEVSEETDVCVIEAMKTFNTIQAGVRGKIAKILVQDGEAVDFNRVLFLVRPS